MCNTDAGFLAGLESGRIVFAQFPCFETHTKTIIYLFIFAREVIAHVQLKGQRGNISPNIMATHQSAGAHLATLCSLSADERCMTEADIRGLKSLSSTPPNPVPRVPSSSALMWKNSEKTNAWISTPRAKKPIDEASAAFIGSVAFIHTHTKRYHDISLPFFSSFFCSVYVCMYA